jgi:opacity protein-like surface antigen
MRTWIKYSGIAAIVLVTCSMARAQNELQLNIGYNVNIPTGGFKNYVTNPAYKGFTAGMSYALSSQLSLGLNVGYNDFYQKYPRTQYSDGHGSSISAVLSNSIQLVPVTFSADYTLLKKGVIRPYIGAGAGANFINFNQYEGEFGNPQSMTKLALFGEAGFLIPVNYDGSTALKIGGTYNYVPFNTYGVGDLDNWGLQAGIRFALK